MVPILLPEARLIVVHYLEPGHPLGTLPKIEMRNEEAGWTAVLTCEWFALELPHHPGLAGGHVCKGKVRGVAGVARGHHMARRGEWPSGGQDGVDRNPPKRNP
jgi:hypothetical protein